jgi:hypothetical protein
MCKLKNIKVQSTAHAKLKGIDTTKEEWKNKK